MKIGLRIAALNVLIALYRIAHLDGFWPTVGSFNLTLVFGALLRWVKPQPEALYIVTLVLIRLAWDLSIILIVRHLVAGRVGDRHE